MSDKLNSSGYPKKKDVMLQMGAMNIPSLQTCKDEENYFDMENI